MYKRKRQKKRRSKKRQKGGILPLAVAAIPALAAVGKTAALGAVSGAASYGEWKQHNTWLERNPKKKNVEEKIKYNQTSLIMQIYATFFYAPYERPILLITKGCAEICPHFCFVT